MVMEKRPDVKIKGLDILERSQTYIPVEQFDGSSIPCGDGAFDVAIFVDVLHHTIDGQPNAETYGSRRQFPLRSGATV